MKKTSIASLVAAFVVAACASTGGGSKNLQDLVDETRQRHPGVARLTVHRAAAGSPQPMVVASTSADKLGKPSDPEDLQAIQTAQTVVLEEAGGLDVTVPVLIHGGKAGAAVGVTLSAAPNKARAEQVAEAQAIAREIEAAMK